MSGYAADHEIEALMVDRYLEALLDRRPADIADLPVALRGAARMLTTDLPRFHPSFRFEEHLAARLARAASEPDAAARDATDRHVVGPGALVAFPARGRGDGRALRPVVIGGVLTSAAISLAGAAVVAWRRTHPSPEATMVRAVRAVARTRPA